MFSEDSGNFAASYSPAKISRKPISKERMMFLRPSEEAQDAIAGAERSRVMVRPTRGGLKGVPAKVVAEKGSKIAEIGSERLRRL